jgi:hypothetical protein
MFAFAGKEYPVSGMTPYQLGQIEAALKDVFPSPLVEHAKLMKLAGDGFTAEERAELFAAARAGMTQTFDKDGVQLSGWPVTFNSTQAQDYLFKGQGIGLFLRVVLSKHMPGITREEGERLGALCGPEDLRRLTELLQVRGPDDEDDDQADAKPAEPLDPSFDLPEGVYDPKA